MHTSDTRVTARSHAPRKQGKSGTGTGTVATLLLQTSPPTDFHCQGGHYTVHVESMAQRMHGLKRALDTRLSKCATNLIEQHRQVAKIACGYLVSSLGFYSAPFQARI